MPHLSNPFVSCSKEPRQQRTLLQLTLDPCGDSFRASLDRDCLETRNREILTDAAEGGAADRFWQQFRQQQQQHRQRRGDEIGPAEMPPGVLQYRWCHSEPTAAAEGDAASKSRCMQQSGGSFRENMSAVGACKLKESMEPTILGLIPPQL